MKTITQKVKNAVLLIGLLLITIIGSAQTTQTFNTTGSFVTPAGVTSVQAEVWGGGGAGGGNTTSSDGAGGGGGGAYSKTAALSVTSGSTYTVTVGTGGTGTTGTGGTGGDSWFNTSGTILAKGGTGGFAPVAGAGGLNGLGGLSASGIGTTKFSGGNGGTGRNSGSGIGGPGGSSAGTAAVGTAGAIPFSTQTAAAAPAGGGKGGNGGTTGNDGGVGLTPGGGGGGSGDGNQLGGNGAPGKVILTYTCPTYALTAAATSNGPLCGAGGSIITLRSTSMPSGTYTVTYNLSGATTATANTSTMTFTAGSPGTGTFSTSGVFVGTTTVTVTNIASGGCTNAIGANNTVSVLVNPILTASVSIAASPAGAVCAGTSVTFTATPTNPGTTPTYQWRVGLANVGTNSTTYTTNTLTTGDSVTCIMVSNATCVSGSPATSNALVMTVNQAPTATAGAAMAVCHSAGAINITAGSSATNYSSVLWTSSGSGTFVNAASLTTCTYAPSAADKAAGSVTLTLTATNPGCTTAVSTKTLTLKTPATAVAGPSIITCYNSGTLNITGGSSASNYASVTWSSSGTGTIVNPNAMISCTYAPSAADIAAGSVTLTLTAAGNSPCSDAVSTKTLTINTPPTAVAGTAISTCSTSGAVNITAGASAANATSVLWTSSGTGTFANATSLTTCTYNPSAADILVGSVTLTLTATTTGCGIDSSTKTLTVYTQPSVTGTTPATRIGAGTVILGATASTGTLYWYAALTGGSALGFGTSFTTPSISVTTTYYVEAVNGTCTSTPRTAVIATVVYPEIDIKGNATTIADGDITPNAADWTDFGTANLTRTFTIYNTNLGALSLGTVTISGANASEFTVTSAPSATVAPGSSTTFTIVFNPTAAGLRTATVTIATNDTDENPYDFSIQGTGVAQEIDILGNATSIVDGDATASTADWTDFSTVTATRTFTIKNNGNVILTLGAITISGVNAADFSVTTPPSATVGAYGTTTFVLTFAPIAINTRTAAISIVNNDANEDPYNFAIQGFGIMPEIDIQGNATSIVDGDTTPVTTDWTDYSTTTVTRTFTIFNLGNTILTLGAMTFTGTNPSDFSVTTAPSSTVGAFSSTTLVITFAPGAIGARSAIFHIANNDTTENPYDFTIQGTGVIQEIDILGNATSIVDGDATPVTTDWTDFSNAVFSRTFTITNSGNIPLTLGTISFTGTNPGDFSVTTPPTATVGAFTSTTVTITFTQGGLGTRSAIFHMVNNDSSENPYDFTIQATGGVPEINIKSQYNVNIADGDTTPSSTDQTDFGNVSKDGGTVIINLTIENTGTGAMSIGATSFTGANAGDFAIVSAPASTIGAGLNSRFKISFTPTTIGIKTATFSVVNSDSDENPYNFDLTGTGVQTYKDTDSDGVTDNKDIDDDNDGIVDTKEQTDGLYYPLTGLVQYTFLNETFGTGTTKGLININTPGATCTYCYEDGYGSACDASTTLEDGEYCVNYKITGALSSDPENIHGDLAWYDGLDHTSGDTNGRMAVFNASFAAGTFYETRIDGVIPNVPISYSFWVLNIMRIGNFPGSILPNITVEFVDLSGNLLSSFTTGSIGRCSATPTDNTCATSNWLQFSTSVNLGDITSFIVRFKNNSTGGGGNDLAIDDINIVQNYIDTDGDGIANIFDLDDENDGIADVEEAGFKVYSSGLSKMDLSGPTWVDADKNGLNDIVDTQIAGSTYLIPDTDGDGVPNYLDLDSDNDSLFDVDEAGMYNGDGDINGDGRGDQADTDKDGILDLYDNNTGFGTTVRTYAQDTDSNGNPDYLQLDSNNDGIKDIQTGLYSSLDANNDGTIDGATDTDKDGITDTFDTNTSVIGSPRDLNRKLFLDFDGRNDYGQSASVLGGLGTASLMAWIDLNSGFSSDGVVVGQDNFQLRITAAKKLEVSLNGTPLTYSTTALSTSRWYHIGATYDGATLKLLLNGYVVASASVSGSLAADTSLLTLGRNPSSSTKFFNGRIDEVRVFNAGLTNAQFQRMVYQEIQNTASQVRGAIVPKDVGSLPFSNVLRYYRMDAYKDDIVDDLTTSSIDTGIGMKIYNNKYIKVQQAPMPFLTERTGNFVTAVNSPTKDINGWDIMDYDWSIVQVKHNITELSNNTDLGMIVDPSVTITMGNDNKMQNDWYLKLDGKIDLVGKSQLVQSYNSDLDVTSAGSIERDQQGQSNKFNYNYWSSPVGAMNTTSNNNAFTVSGVMKDGTNPASPQNLQWTSGYDGSAATSPITLSNYWIFKFQNLTPQYANWASVGPNGSLLTAQGFTLKGSAAATATQNYTFVGKPNNGTISNPIAANNANLSGNPYPSAIDSNQFIAGNNSSTTGTIYFWEHFPTNSSHNLIQYQGGYAARTLVGGTPPVSPAGISGLGSSTRTPKRFIPVGQGFLLYGSATGGNIVFDNSMRLFIKEDDAANSNVLFKQNPSGPIAQFDNSEDTFEEDNFARIRIGFNSQNGFHRQLLLGFMDQNATSGYDVGYDAKQIDNQPNEMTFINGTEKLVIQGDGYFNDTNIYPLGVKTGAEGNVTFTLDGTENFDEGQDVFIYDSVTDTYHDIRSEAFEINLSVGSVDNRFSLRFRSNTLATNHFELGNEVIVNFTNSDDMINIRNMQTDLTVEGVTLFNILGQKINDWNVKNDDQTKIQIPVRNVSTGTYIVNVHTTTGDISKKIIIR